MVEGVRVEINLVIMGLHGYRPDGMRTDKFQPCGPGWSSQRRRQRTICETMHQRSKMGSGSY